MDFTEKNLGWCVNVIICVCVIAYFLIAMCQCIYDLVVRKNRRRPR